MNYDSNSISVRLGQGAGSFGARADFGVGTNPGSVAVGDLNGDGMPDLVAANYGDYPERNGTVSVLLGNGDGSFGDNTDYATGAHPVRVAIGDLNGDGRPEVVTANHEREYWPGASTPSCRVRIRRPCTS